MNLPENLLYMSPALDACDDMGGLKSLKVDLKMSLLSTAVSKAWSEQSSSRFVKQCFSYNDIKRPKVQPARKLIDQE